MGQDLKDFLFGYPHLIYGGIQLDLESAIYIVLFVGAIQGVLLATALFFIRRGQRRANRLLSLLVFLFSLMIFFHSMNAVSVPVSDLDAHDHLGLSFVFLFGPLFFLYARSLTRPEIKLSPEDLVHGLPFFFSAVALTLQLNVTFPVLDILFAVVLVTLMISYLILVILMLKRHGRYIREAFSSVEKISLNWLWFLTIGYLIIWPLAFVAELTGKEFLSWDVIWLLISVFIYLMGYLALWQPQIFFGSGRDHLKKYAKSTLDPGASTALYSELLHAMDTTKPYLEKDITLPELAARLHASVHHLSQVINEHYKQNFFDFVNGYRVEAAKTMLENPACNNLTIAAIGFESGFNSISSFNAAFKKKTGLTPSQYRQQVK